MPFTYYIDIDFYTKYWQHPIHEQTAKAPVMMMISNCEPKSPRNQYLAELMRYIDIDSEGDGRVAVVGGQVEHHGAVQVHHRH